MILRWISVHLFFCLWCFFVGYFEHRVVHMKEKFLLRKAELMDVTAVENLVQRAYSHYIDRIGSPPGPMLDDYKLILKDHTVWIIEDVFEKQLAGLLVLIKQPKLLLDNIAVDPEYQGKGLGKELMALAESEAKVFGYDAIELYTHVKMVENIALYGKLGYIERERKVERGLERVYMEKELTTI